MLLVDARARQALAHVRARSGAAIAREERSHARHQVRVHDRTDVAPPL
jgi:hypothetical protein